MYNLWICRHTELPACLPVCVYKIFSLLLYCNFRILTVQAPYLVFILLGDVYHLSCVASPFVTTLCYVILCCHALSRSHYYLLPSPVLLTSGAEQ